MYLIDANIFLEMLLEQERADECEILLGKFYQGSLFGYVSSFSLHAIEVVLDRYGKLDELRKFLNDIHNCEGLKRIETNTLEELAALDSTGEFGLDVDDAINYYICKIFNFKIISFDKHFDKTDIIRIKPLDVI